MPITTFGGEKQVSELATRVYGNLSAAELKLAEEALVKANPHLENPKTAKPGAIVIVPDVPGLKAQTAAPGTAQEPGPGGVAQVARTLELYQKQLAQAASDEAADIKDTRAQLKSAEVKRLAGQFQLQAQLAAIEQAAKARESAAKDADTFAGKTIAEIQGDLKALVGGLK